MTDPAPAPTTSVSSDQVKAVPTIEDRLTVLEDRVSAMMADGAQSQSTDKRLQEVEAFMNSVRVPKPKDE